MGLNLQVVKFHYWLENMIERSFQNEFKRRLKNHIGQEFEFSRLDIVDVDTGYPRVGSYTAYGIFRYCIQFLVTGDFQDQLELDSRPEKEALYHFRDRLKPASIDIPYVGHILETNDADTLFLPIFF